MSAKKKTTGKKVAPASKAKPSAKKAAAKKAPAKSASKKAKPAVKKAKATPAKKAAPKKPVSKTQSPAAKKTPVTKKVTKKPAPAKAAKKAPPAKKAAAKAPSKSSVKSKTTAKSAKAAPAKSDKKSPPKAAPKKTATKKAPASKKEPAVKKEAVAPAPKPVAKKKKKSTSTPLATPSEAISKAPLGRMPRATKQDEESDFVVEPSKGPVKMTGFLKKQKQRLQDLRDAYLNMIEGVSNETIRQRPEDGAGSAFGMHQADAGSDAYDRDFALSLLGKEQDALYEINEALKRVEHGTYGICEMSGEKILHERLEALPFARYTVACQEKIERGQMGGSRWSGSRPQRSVFGLDDASTTSADTNDDDDGDSLDKRGD